LWWLKCNNALAVKRHHFIATLYQIILSLFMKRFILSWIKQLVGFQMPKNISKSLCAACVLWSILIGLFCTSFNKLNFYSSLMIFFSKPYQAEIQHQRLVLMMNDKIINFLLILWLFLNSCWVHNKNCWFLQKLLCVMLFWCCCLRSSIFLKFEKRDLLIHKILPSSDFFSANLYRRITSYKYMVIMGQ
jgi:hypothetical protein